MSSTALLTLVPMKIWMRMKHWCCLTCALKNSAASALVSVDPLIPVWSPGLFSWGNVSFCRLARLNYFGYEQSAPPRYFAMMKEKLDLLEQSGVKICSLEGIESELLGMAAVKSALARPTQGIEPAESKALSDQRSGVAGSSFRVDKRVLTEKDLIEARMNGATTV